MGFTISIDLRRSLSSLREMGGAAVRVTVGGKRTEGHSLLAKAPIGLRFQHQWAQSSIWVGGLVLVINGRWDPIEDTAQDDKGEGLARKALSAGSNVGRSWREFCDLFRARNTCRGLPV